MSSAIQSGLAFDVYAAAKATNASALKHMAVSPLHYRHYMDHERPDTDAMRVGRACHTAILEPDRFMTEYVLWPEGRRAGKEWQAFVAMAGERTILTRDQYDLALRMRDAVRSHAVAGRLLSERGEAELSITWTHERTGVQIKSRLDYLTASTLIDLKTSRDVTPALFAAQAARLGYALQLALYVDGVAAVGRGYLPPKMIAVQSSEPHDVVVYDVPDEVVLLGRAQYEAALDRLVECERTGVWPGQYPDEAVTLHLPAWAMPDDEIVDGPDSSAPIQDADF